MPNYRYECPFCHRFAEEHRDIANRDRLPWCPNCKTGMSRVYTMPYISVDARPTSAGEAHAAVRRERGWKPDMDAYARLRKDGVQPKHVDGSAKLEARADTKTEIEMGKIMPTRDVKDGVDLSSHMLQKDLDV